MPLADHALRFSRFRVTVFGMRKRSVEVRTSERKAGTSERKAGASERKVVKKELAARKAARKAVEKELAARKAVGKKDRAASTRVFNEVIYAVEIAERAAKLETWRVEREALARSIHEANAAKKAAKLEAKRVEREALARSLDAAKAAKIKAAKRVKKPTRIEVMRETLRKEREARACPFVFRDGKRPKGMAVWQNGNEPPRPVNKLSMAEMKARKAQRAVDNAASLARQKEWAESARKEKAERDAAAAAFVGPHESPLVAFARLFANAGSFNGVSLTDDDDDDEVDLRGW